MRWSTLIIVSLALGVGVAFLPIPDFWQGYILGMGAIILAYAPDSNKDDEND